MARGFTARKGIACGSVGCVLVLLAIGGFVWFIYTMVFTNTVAKWMGEETYPLKGDVSRFDPMAGLAEVKAKVGEGAYLVKLSVTSVRADGTMDLHATYSPGPRADYEFERKLDKAPNGKTEPPIGAGRTPNSVWIEAAKVTVSKPGQRRHVTRRGGNSSSEYNYTMEGMDIDRDSRLAEPEKAAVLKPSIKDMWAVAIKAGTPRDAVAMISYDADGATFNIPSVMYLQWKDGKLQEFGLSKEAREKLGYDQ